MYAWSKSSILHFVSDAKYVIAELKSRSVTDCKYCCTVPSGVLASSCGVVSFNAKTAIKATIEIAATEIPSIRLAF